MPVDHRRPPGALFVPSDEHDGPTVESRRAAAPVEADRPAPRVRRRPSMRRVVAVPGVALLGALVVWRVVLSAARLPAVVGETQLIDGAAAMVRSGGRRPVDAGLEELVQARRRRADRPQGGGRRRTRPRGGFCGTHNQPLAVIGNAEMDARGRSCAIPTVRVPGESIV